MKNLFKIITVAVGTLAGACLPIWGFYNLWLWCMAEIGNAGEYIGAIKVLITVLMVLLGGSLTFALSFWLAIIIGMLLAAIID